MLLNSSSVRSGLLYAIVAVVLIDASLACFPGIPPVTGLAVTRLLQAIALVWILLLSPRGISVTGLTGHRLVYGIKTGMAACALMGVITVMAGASLYLAGIPPHTWVKIPLPENSLFLYCLTGCFLGPIAEELFFRGFVYARLRKFGILPAVLLSAFLFALCHPLKGLPFVQFSGGLVFAASFEYSKSLATPLIIHIIGNTALFAGALLALG